MTMQIKIHHVLIGMICLFSVHVSLAQPLDYPTKELDGTAYLVPTVEVLARFLTWTMPEWEAAMDSLGYVCQTGAEYADQPVYLKGEIDRMALGICKNQALGLVSFDWFNWQDHRSLIDDFVESLKAHYVDSARI